MNNPINKPGKTATFHTTPRRLCAIALIMATVVLLPSPAIQAAESQQGFVACPPFGKQDLLTVPEITRDAAKHRLRGVVTAGDELRLLWFKSTPTYCASQYMRYLDNGQSFKIDGLPEPLPGPTLRARIGDTVELTFLNQINPQDFGQSIDRGEQGLGCDKTTLYPANTQGNDVPPNCFHGSSTANLHFHGTHTSPGTTGDNVLIQVRPSPRDANGKPIVTKELAEGPWQFNEFFSECEKQYAQSVDPFVWPTQWDQLPLAYRTAQEEKIKSYDKTAPYNGKIGLPDGQKLWPKNEEAIKNKLWPQYYIGAYPYCFHLPEYTDKTWPPANPEALQMGQSPGTQWYHAHKHGSTAIDVANGISGAFIIEGAYDDTLRDFYKTTYDHKNWGLKEQVLVIQGLGVTPNLEKSRKGRAGFLLSVNGRQQPVLSMRPGEVQLWRVINTSAKDGLYIPSPPVGTLAWRQTAQDGVQLHEKNFYAQTSSEPLALAGGNRADLLVLAPTLPAPTPQDPHPEKIFQVKVAQTVSFPNPPPAATTVLLNVRVKADPAIGNPDPAMAFPSAGKFPVQPPFLADIADQEIKKTRELYFNTAGGSGGNPAAAHTIGSNAVDGKKFSEVIAQSMARHTAEEWKVSNGTSDIAHPFHIHINPFQVVEVFAPNDPIYVFDKPAAGKCYVDPKDPKTWKPCDLAAVKPPFVWWDVFAIPTANTSNGVTIPGYFKMRSRFEDYSGTFVLHCHILAHEDRGMMQLIEVMPKGQTEPGKFMLEHH